MSKPYDAEKEFGVKGQVKVKATFDGYEYRGSLVRMGCSCHWIGITKKIRKAIVKNPSDSVRVTVERDLEKREAAPPDDFKQGAAARRRDLSILQGSLVHASEGIRA